MTKTSVTVNIDNFDEIFPIVDSRELIGHEFLKHKPKNRLQEIQLATILKGINLALPAFRVPCMDPSIEDGKIVFKPGNKPAIGYSALWWRETWEKFMPDKNSRSGTELHWAALLGKQMKYLVDVHNYSVEEVWTAVCDDSRDLGHYWNSKDAKHDFEPTGSRKIGLFCDLANTCKIIEKWEAPGFLLASGYYNSNSMYYSLAARNTISNPDLNCYFGVGWLVLDV